MAIRLQSSDDADLPVPLVTLHLRNGRTESGWVITRSVDPVDGDCLLLQAPGDNLSQPNADALYIMTASIDAIIVHQIGPVAHILSFGAIASPLNASDISRMDVKRKAHELGLTLSADIGTTIAFELGLDDIAETPEALRAVLDCVKQTAAVLKAFGTDAVGREAIAKAVHKIALQQGTKTVTLQKNTLHVTADFAKGSEGMLTSEDLRKAISSVL